MRIERRVPNLALDHHQAAAVEVEALVLAAGRGERLGLGPKAPLTLGGRTLVERAIAVMLSVAQRVIVGVPGDDLERFQTPHGDKVLFLPGGRTRMETELRLFRASAAPLIVVHDVVHPFVTPKLAQRVVEAARRTGAAMAAVRVTSYVYRGEPRLTERIVASDALWLSRKPLACWRSALARALEGGAPPPASLGSAELLLAAAQPVEVVPVEPWNIKLTTPGDWKLAEALDPLLASGSLADPRDPPDALGLGVRPTEG